MTTACRTKYSSTNTTMTINHYKTKKSNCFLLKNENGVLHKEQIDVLWSGCHSCCSFPIPSSSQTIILPSSIRNRIRDKNRIIDVLSSTLPFNDMSIE